MFCSLRKTNYSSDQKEKESDQKEKEEERCKSSENANKSTTCSCRIVVRQMVQTCKQDHRKNEGEEETTKMSSICKPEDEDEEDQKSEEDGHIVQRLEHDHKLPLEGRHESDEFQDPE